MRYLTKVKLSGLVVSFRCKGYDSIGLHKPHGQKTLQNYQIITVIKILERGGLI